MHKYNLGVCSNRGTWKTIKLGGGPAFLWNLENDEPGERNLENDETGKHYLFWRLGLWSSLFQGPVQLWPLLPGSVGPSAPPCLAHFVGMGLKSKIKANLP